MPNCVLYVLPNPRQENRFDANGNYQFDLWFETDDANRSMGELRAAGIAFSSSDQTIDNALKDATIAAASAEFNVILTRNDIRIFR